MKTVAVSLHRRLPSRGRTPPSRPPDLAAQVETMLIGVLIIFFLIVEPLGLAALWRLGKEKLRLWPFPH